MYTYIVCSFFLSLSPRSRYFLRRKTSCPRIATFFILVLLLPTCTIFVRPSTSSSATREPRRDTTAAFVGLPKGCRPRPSKKRRSIAIFNYYQFTRRANRPEFFYRAVARETEVRGSIPSPVVFFLIFQSKSQIFRPSLLFGQRITANKVVRTRVNGSSMKIYEIGDD